MACALAHAAGPRRELPDGHRGAAGGQRGESARGTGGQRCGARWQCGQCPPWVSGARHGLAAVAGQHDRGGAAGPEGCRARGRAVQPERGRQGPVAAAVCGPGGDQAGGWPGARGEQRGRAAGRAGQPEYLHGLAGQGGGQRGPCRVPGPAGAGEDARGARLAARAGEQRLPGRAERGGGEVLQPAAAAGGCRGEGPLGGQGRPAGVAGCGQLGRAVGGQGEQVPGGGGGGQGVGDVGQGPVERAGR